MKAEPPPRLAFIGLRCSGKTSVGRRVAALLGRPFVDLDAELSELHAAEHGRDAPRVPAGTLLGALGEQRFRALEERALRAVCEREGEWVLATGGGAVLRAANRVRLAERCVCIWLRASPAVLGARLAQDPSPRPSLTGGDPCAELELLERERGGLYAELAELTLDVERTEVEELSRKVIAQRFDAC